MIILFLDDDLQRHELMRKALADKHTIIHAFEHDECLKAIATCKDKIDLGMFDYNLGGAHAMDIYCGGKKTGMDVVNFMVKHIAPEKWMKRAIVHTNNVSDGLGLVARFSRADIEAKYVPFSQGLLKLLARTTEEGIS